MWIKAIRHQLQIESQITWKSVYISYKLLKIKPSHYISLFFKISSRTDPHGTVKTIKDRSKQNLFQLWRADFGATFYPCLSHNWFTISHEFPLRSPGGWGPGAMSLRVRLCACSDWWNNISTMFLTNERWYFEIWRHDCEMERDFASLNQTVIPQLFHFFFEHIYPLPLYVYLFIYNGNYSFLKEGFFIFL